MTTTTVPITVTPEAQAFVLEKGIEQEFEQMLEQALQTVPGLRSLKVVKEEDYTCGGNYLNIEANRDPSQNPLEDRTDRQWRDWRSDTFPVEVSVLVILTSYYEENHGR